MLDHKRLLELLSYTAETGIFVWNDAPSISGRYKTNSRAGKVAGSVSNVTGYRVISCDGTLYNGHRLAWFYAHGEWPDDRIDHANGDRSDNRLCNLRQSSSAQNNWNRGVRVDSKTGLKGVILCATTGKWRARIRANGKTFNLGRHDTPEAAHAAYCEAAKRLHGEFARAA